MNLNDARRRAVEEALRDSNGRWFHAAVIQKRMNALVGKPHYQDVLDALKQNGWVVHHRPSPRGGWEYRVVAEPEPSLWSEVAGTSASST